MKKAMKLQTKIILLVVTVVFVSISIIILFVISWATGNIENKVRTNIMNVAEMVAHSREIIDELKVRDPNQKIDYYVNTQLKNLELVDYIIIADSDEIRYSHPNHEMIGKKFVGGDQYRAIQKGEAYISEATGTLGKALRAFAPIYDEENKKEIGFVAVGTLTNDIEKAKYTAVLYIILIGLVGLTTGIIGAVLLANNIKNTLMGLEPEEITKLYNEKMAILNTIHEGLISVDHMGRITLISNSALKILHFEDNIKKENITGKNIEEVIPDTRIMNVLKTGKPEFEVEQRINNTIIITNIVPLMNKERVIGAITSFRDKTEITKMAEELTGVKKMAWSLRAQNHEFMNKLHTISGLIQLEEYDKVLEFISDITKSRNNISNILTQNIKDSSVSALLLSKYIKAEECRVKLKIDEDSKLTKLPENITSEEIVSVLGNLIENSLDEVKNDGTGLIYIKIVQNEEFLNIIVKDNGGGISVEFKEKIYERGFSTKDGQRGYGMYIVKKIIDESNGIIKLDVNNGVIWNITIPMTRSDKLD
ncbi:MULTISPECIES: Spo0B domain-containing protein [Clostridium]|jgi:two-component system, CitB family, sensor kinase|uniref:histidine kinase n=2 Tax=Clostridium TaxID=1485 RepID=A0A151ANU0_9CLOT|nr:MULTISPECIES: sensor histidine kinase [Clostridium]KYH29288.1 sensor histidine kinase DcuS [Clostridium colicanis DSM 13634]PRR70998.1 Sensor histidine kinase DcuS [Clostridium thermopalmarium DSM 5974]PVZ23662.1 two-component system CitB family sensor kinase [Clostridium thermopalmarium DSM 5974]